MVFDQLLSERVFAFVFFPALVGPHLCWPLRRLLLQPRTSFSLISFLLLSTNHMCICLYVKFRDDAYPSMAVFLGYFSSVSEYSRRKKGMESAYSFLAHIYSQTKEKRDRKLQEEYKGFLQFRNKICKNGCRFRKYLSSTFPVTGVEMESFSLHHSPFLG